MQKHKNTFSPFHRVPKLISLCLGDIVTQLKISISSYFQIGMAWWLSSHQWEFYFWVGQHHRLNEHEFQQTLGNSKRQGRCSSWGHKQWIWLSDWTTTTTISSVQFSCSVLSDSLRPYELQHARPHSNPCPSSRWCHPTISSSVVPFSSCPQSFPASGSFPMSQFFVSGGQIIGVSASTSVLPKNTQDWSPLGWTGWISLQSKELSRVFSNTTVQKHQFFGVLLSL